MTELGLQLRVERHTHLAEFGSSFFFFHPAMGHQIIKYLSCKR